MQQAAAVARSASTWTTRALRQGTGALLSHKAKAPKAKDPKLAVKTMSGLLKAATEQLLPYYNYRKLWTNIILY